jgi:hypothetical protein
MRLIYNGGSGTVKYGEFDYSPHSRNRQAKESERKVLTVENYIIDMKELNSLNARFRSSALPSAFGNTVSIVSETS